MNLLCRNNAKIWAGWTEQIFVSIGATRIMTLLLVMNNVHDGVAGENSWLLALTVAGAVA